MVKKVSVIIPTKDRMDTTLRSLRSVKNQSLAPSEIIVVDDGSRDGTYEKIKVTFPDVKVIRNEISRGGAIARNQGANIATGDFIAFLDSDDEWAFNHLESKIKILCDKKADGIYGSFFLKDNYSSKEVIFHEDFPLEYMIGDKIASFNTHDARTSTLVFERRSFLSLKFDENLKKHQDWDLVINFEKKYNLVLDNNPTTIIHIDSLHSRMSNKLHHASTLYFLQKNKLNFQCRGFYNICLKMVMYSRALSDEKYTIQYLNLIKEILNGLNTKDKLIYYGLRYRIINLDYIRRLTFWFRH